MPVFSGLVKLAVTMFRAPKAPHGFMVFSKDWPGFISPMGVFIIALVSGIARLALDIHIRLCDVGARVSGSGGNISGASSRKGHNCNR